MRRITEWYRAEGFVSLGLLAGIMAMVFIVVFIISAGGA